MSKTFYVPVGTMVVTRATFYSQEIDINDCDKIVFPDSVIKIGSCALSGLSNLKTIVWSKRLSVIEEKAFKNSGIEEIVLPDSVVRIESEAFSYCTSLKKVVLPRKLKIIRKKCFYHCDNLESISIPERVETIEDEAFLGCEKLKNIELPKALRKIGGCSFAYTGLTDLFLPKNVRNIDSGTFWCSNLQKIEIDPENPFITTNDTGNALIHTSNNQLFYTCQQGGKIIIPKGTRTIGDQAFAYNDNIKEIVIPNSVQYIDCYAFSECHNLEKVKILRGLKGIGYNAFEYCKSLKEIKIPDTVTAIQENAFLSCENLKEVKLPRKIKYIQGDALTGIAWDSKIYCTESVAKILNEYSGYDKRITELVII